MKNAFLILLAAITLWAGLASLIFAFRHPWATDTERFLHIPDAIMLRKLSYAEMRP